MRLSDRPVSRRRFLLLGLLVAAALVATLGLSYRWAFSDRGRIALVKATLRRRLDHVVHDEAVLSRFAREYLGQMPRSTRSDMSAIALLLPVYLYTGLLALTPLDGRVRLYEETVISKYLLSTDYFYRRDGATGPLRYVGLYWPPHRMPCGNPFAVLT